MKLEDEVRARKIIEASPAPYEKWRVINQAWFEFFMELLKRNAEEMGWDKINKNIVEFLSGTKKGDFMPHQWEALSSLIDIKERDAIAAAKHFAYVAECVGMDYVFTECNPKRVSIKVTRCPEIEWIKEMGLFGKVDWNGECAVAYCPTLAKVINPKLEYIDGKSQCRGDDCCEKTWELKG